MASTVVRLTPIEAAVIGASDPMPAYRFGVVEGGWCDVGSDIYLDLEVTDPVVPYHGGTNAIDVYKLETLDGITWYGQAVQNVS